MKLILQHLKNMQLTRMANYLRRHGYVVLDLPVGNRECKDGFCWLKVHDAGRFYSSEEKGKPIWS